MNQKELHQEIIYLTKLVMQQHEYIQRLHQQLAAQQREQREQRVTEAMLRREIRHLKDREAKS